MLKLTSRRDRSLIYVAPAHIASISESGKGSTIYLAGGNFHETFEAPKEILAMPGMVEYSAITMNPRMLVEPGRPTVTLIERPDMNIEMRHHSFRPLGEIVSEVVEKIDPHARGKGE